MAFTSSSSLSPLTLHIFTTPTKPSSTLFTFPTLPLKTPRNTLQTLSCTAKPETALPCLSLAGIETPSDTFKYDVDFDEYDVDDEIEHGGICAVPKKRLSRSKGKIRLNIWKGKARVAAKKAYSLAKSIATGNSKSFLVITKSSSSSTTPPSSSSMTHAKFS